MKFKTMKTTLAVLLASGAMALGLAGCGPEQGGETPTPEPPIEEPTITVNLGSYVGEKGSVIPSVLSAEVGEVVTYTITPAKDYDLFNIRVNGTAPELTYDTEKDIYTFNWTVVNEGMLFEPTFLADEAIITEGEVAELDGTYDFYWIRTNPVSWNVSGDGYEVYIDPSLEKVVLPSWAGTTAVQLDLNVNGVVADSGIYTLPSRVIGVEGTSLSFNRNVRFAVAGEELSLEGFDINLSTPVSGGLLFTSDVPTTLSDITFLDADPEDDVAVLESYSNFGDLTYFNASNVNFGALPLKLTHVGEVVLDGNIFESTLTIDQGVSGRSFKVINNDFSQISGPAIYVSKETDVTMTAVSEIAGNIFNDKTSVNVVHGDGVSYDSQFADTLLTITDAKVDNHVNK